MHRKFAQKREPRIRGWLSRTHLYPAPVILAQLLHRCLLFSQHKIVFLALSENSNIPTSSESQIILPLPPCYCLTLLLLLILWPTLTVNPGCTNLVGPQYHCKSMSYDIFSKVFLDVFSWTEINCRSKT